MTADWRLRTTADVFLRCLTEKHIKKTPIIIFCENQSDGRRYRHRPGSRPRLKSVIDLWHLNQTTLFSPTKSRTPLKTSGEELREEAGGGSDFRYESNTLNNYCCWIHLPSPAADACYWIILLKCFSVKHKDPSFRQSGTQQHHEITHFLWELKDPDCLKWPTNTEQHHRPGGGLRGPVLRSRLQYGCSHVKWQLTDSSRIPWNDAQAPRVTEPAEILCGLAASAADSRTVGGGAERAATTQPWPTCDRLLHADRTTAEQEAASDGSICRRVLQQLTNHRQNETQSPGRDVGQENTTIDWNTKCAVWNLTASFEFCSTSFFWLMSGNCDASVELQSLNGRKLSD